MLNPAEFNLDWINDYEVFHKNIDKEEGRGLIMYIHKTLKAEEIKLDTNFQENMFVKVQINKNEHLLTGIVYRSPSENSPSYHERLRTLISEAAKTKHTHHLIMGDFNYPSIDWDTLSTGNTESEGNKFVECLQDNYLFQIIDQPTRCRGSDKPNILDLVITENMENITEVEYQSPLGKSDHCVVTFNFVCSVKLSRTTKERRCYNKADNEKFKEDLREIDCEAYLDTIGKKVLHN